MRFNPVLTKDGAYAIRKALEIDKAWRKRKRQRKSAYYKRVQRKAA